MDHSYRRIVSSAVLCLPLLAACSGSNRQITQAPPPVIDTPSPAVVEGSTPTRSEESRDPLAKVLIQVRELTERGDTRRREGDITRARGDFEAALDLLWDYSRERETPIFEVEREIDYLVVLLETLRAAEESEGAAIDDLAELETSTEAPDPLLRERVESEMEELDSDLPIQVHDRVLSFLEYYAEGNGRGSIELGLERVGLYGPMIRRIFLEEGVPKT